MRPALGAMSALLVRMWNALLDLVYPPHCVACGRRGAWLCDACLRIIPKPEGPRCHRCGGPAAEGRLLCRDCERGDQALEGSRAVSLHLTPLREAVHGLKYEGLQILAEPLSALLAEACQRANWPVEIIVPVPLHERRVRQRGYNQAHLLAEALAKRLDRPLEAQVLVRARHTRSQIGLTRESRWANVHGAFRCLDGSLCGKNILLVDDVHTTGATLESCAQALRASGSAHVWAVTLTRAIGFDDRIGGHKEITSAD